MILVVLCSELQLVPKQIGYLTRQLCHLQKREGVSGSSCLLTVMLFHAQVMSVSSTMSCAGYLPDSKATDRCQNCHAHRDTHHMAFISPVSEPVHTLG